MSRSLYFSIRPDERFCGGIICTAWTFLKPEEFALPKSMPLKIVFNTSDWRFSPPDVMLPLGVAVVDFGDGVVVRAVIVPRRRYGCAVASDSVGP